MSSHASCEKRVRERERWVEYEQRQAELGTRAVFWGGVVVGGITATLIWAFALPAL